MLSAFLTRLKSRARLEAEVLALRHQVNILNRTAPKRVRFIGFDRLLFVWLYRLWPEWISRQISEAFSCESLPANLIRDRDAANGEVFKRRPRAMGIRDRPTARRSPWQNGYVERLIGSIRRECLDHVIIFSEWHLRRVLVDYSDYYNTRRTHRLLRKDTPTGRPVTRQGEIPAFAHLGGLHHSFVRI